MFSYCYWFNAESSSSDQHITVNTIASWCILTWLNGKCVDLVTGFYSLCGTSWPACNIWWATHTRLGMTNLLTFITICSLCSGYWFVRCWGSGIQHYPAQALHWQEDQWEVVLCSCFQFKISRNICVLLLYMSIKYATTFWIKSRTVKKWEIIGCIIFPVFLGYRSMCIL